MKVLFTLSLLVLCPLAVLGTPSSAGQLEQHEWLQQLVGEWEVSSDADMGGSSVAWKSKETVRSVGGLWVVVEGTAETGGQPFTSLMTLGYDPRKKTFVGSYVDTMQTTLWTYVGHLDESKRILALEAEGPGFDPSKDTKFRETIELVGADEKRFESSMLGADGEWHKFMTVTARRVK